MTDAFSPDVPLPGSTDPWASMGGLPDPGSAITQTGLIEQCVWVVAVSLLKKADASVGMTVYLSHEYWDEGELYSGSPVIYPLLAGERDDLIIKRGIGREVAVLHEPQVEIYGKSDIWDYGDSFYDLRDDYTFENARVDVYCYFKERGQLASVSSANERQLYLRVRAVVWEGDVLSLLCRQVMFEDKEVSRRLDRDDFTSMVEEYDQQYGAIVFGQSVVINSPFIVTDTADEGSIFCGFTATSHQMQQFNSLWAENRESPRDDAYVQIAIASVNADSHGIISVAPFGATSDAIINGRAVVFSPGDDASIIAFVVEAALTKTGSPTSADGHGRMFIARAPELTNEGVYTEEAVLREIVLDSFPSGSVQSVWGYVYPPLVMTPNENYLIAYEWTNPDAGQGFVIRLSASATQNPFERSNSSKESWQTSSFDPIMALYGFQNDSPSFSATVASPVPHARYNFIVSTTTNPTLKSANTDGKLYYGLTLKSNVNGLIDDGSGTYTGAVSGLIETPADIIRFLLLEDEIGRGLASTALDLTTFTSVRTAQEADGLAMAFAIERQTFLAELVLRILRQSRTIMYLKRDGDIALRYPTYSSTPAARISEGQWGSEMHVFAVADSSDNEIVNDIEIQYGPNRLNPIKDRDLLKRLGGSDSYLSITSVNADAASDLDASRVVKAALSEDLYGKRSIVEPFDLHGSTSTGPTTVRNYWLDRWYKSTQTVSVRVPLIEFYDRDLFDIVQVAHSQIPTKYGTGRRLRWGNSGNEVTWYDEGIPVTWRSYGSSIGEIIDVTEAGDDMVLTIQTMNPF